MRPVGDVMKTCLDPNATPEMLMHLAYWGYHEILQNPVLPLLLLENPNLLKRIQTRLALRGPRNQLRLF